MAANQNRKRVFYEGEEELACKKCTAGRDGEASEYNNLTTRMFECENCQHLTGSEESPEEANIKSERNPRIARRNGKNCNNHHSKSLSSLVVLLFAIFLQLSDAQRCYQKVIPRGGSGYCDPNSRYRTISGRCNNLNHPEWGSAGQTMNRFLPNAYADGRQEPRGGRYPSSLPSPRWISQKNHPDTDSPDSRFTHMVMQFGQFLDHDLTHAPKDENLDCCTRGVQSPSCMTIPIPDPDRFFSWVNDSVRCMNFVRSTEVCRLNVREQYNDITAYVDAGVIYGSDDDHAAVLRTYKDGKLAQNHKTNQLPTREQLNLRPNLNLLRPESPQDFMAGDMRVNEHPFLATLHVVFVREHNRVAKLLREYLPAHLRTDEILYQETRRIIAAQLQNVVYGEYLPTVLGVDSMKKYDLIVEEVTRYDPEIDATVFNAFSAAAFRFGHSLVNGHFKLISQRKSRSKDDIYWLWRLREVFDGQSIRGARLPIENMIEGLITQEPQTCDAFFSTEITDHLFQKNTLRENFGLDLLALNIQRGRDHGLPGYNKYRRACGLREIRSWRQKPEELEQKYWNQLQEVYERVDDIDLYIGAIGESNVRGGVVGPTFACLIADQFSRLKRGDRFFYTHDNGFGLGPVTKNEVLKRTLGDIMCDVATLDKVQKWVTLQPNTDYNNFESCLSKHRLDMRAIANEIARELSSPTPQPAARTVVPTSTFERSRSGGGRNLAGNFRSPGRGRRIEVPAVSKLPPRRQHVPQPVRQPPRPVGVPQRQQTQTVGVQQPRQQTVGFQTLTNRLSGRRGTPLSNACIFGLC